MGQSSSRCPPTQVIPGKAATLHSSRHQATPGGSVATQALPMLGLAPPICTNQCKPQRCHDCGVSQILRVHILGTCIRRVIRTKREYVAKTVENSLISGRFFCQSLKKFLFDTPTPAFLHTLLPPFTVKGVVTHPKYDGNYSS